MVISNKSQPGDYEIEKQGNIDILKINCQNYPYLPSVEDNIIGQKKL